MKEIDRCCLRVTNEQTNAQQIFRYWRLLLLSFALSLVAAAARAATAVTPGGNGDDLSGNRRRHGAAVVDCNWRWLLLLSLRLLPVRATARTKPGGMEQNSS